MRVFSFCILPLTCGLISFVVTRDRDGAVFACFLLFMLVAMAYWTSLWRAYPSVRFWQRFGCLLLCECSAVVGYSIDPKVTGMVGMLYIFIPILILSIVGVGEILLLTRWTREALVRKQSTGGTDVLQVPTDAQRKKGLALFFGAENSSAPPKRRLQFSLRGLFLVTIVCAIGLSLVASFPDFFRSEGCLLLLIFGLVAYSLPSLVLCGPAWWFGRKRVSYWYKWEFLVLVAPYLVWVLLMLLVSSSGKGPANLLEPVLLAFASVLAPLGRIALAKKTVSPQLVAIGALLAVCALAVIVWDAVPGEWPGEHFHNLLGPFE